jgi:hypothetical protein
MRYRTVNQIMSAGPCIDYPRARVEGLFAGRSRISNHAVAKLDIPAADRLWALLVYMTPQEQRLFACDCAERALLLERKDGREPDKRSWRAIEVSRQYALGHATDDELTAAMDAAWAAWAAWASWAAWAAWAAAWAAACAEALASEDAARAIVEISTMDYDNATEREWQIAHALEMMDYAKKESEQ